MNITRITGITAVIFYVLCWFTIQPTILLYYIGIALPWLSLLISIPIAYLCKVRDDGYFLTWGYVYAAVTLIYVIAASLMAGSLWQQLPYAAACSSIISYFALEAANKSTRL